MAIRPEINGKTANVAKIYGTLGGVHHEVTRAYLECDGKTSFLWSKKGTEENPYLISTPQELGAINNNLSAYYRLTCDINFSAYQSRPIGTTAEPFTGDFDGNGFRISNCNSGGTRAGVFGVSKGYVHDLSVEHYAVNNSGCKGAIVENNAAEGVIERCHVKITRLNKVPQFGGVSHSNAGMIQDCRTMVSQASDSTSCYTGIAYLNTGTIRRCYSKIGGTNYYDGASSGITVRTLAWFNGGEIQGCYAPDGLWYYKSQGAIINEIKIGTYPLIETGTQPVNCAFVKVDDHGKSSSFPFLDFDSVWKWTGWSEAGLEKTPAIQSIRQS